MERLIIIGGLFVLAGLCEIGGGYLVWGWMREHKPLAWALIGALILVAYGVVAALQPISDRAGTGVGRPGGRVQARPVGPAGGSDLRGWRGGDGRPDSGVMQHYASKVGEGTFSGSRTHAPASVDTSETRVRPTGSSVSSGRNRQLVVSDGYGRGDAGEARGCRRGPCAPGLRERGLYPASPGSRRATIWGSPDAPGRA
jgi:Uncharacterised BCR, YnfA/UPF0060 family